MNQLTDKQYRKNKTNQFQMGIHSTKKKSKGRGKQGYNSFKFSVLNRTNTEINTIDLNGIYTEHEIELFIEGSIEKTLKSKNYPLKVITHSVVDKIIIFNKVLKRYSNLKSLVLDPCNPYTYCVVKK